MTTVSGNIATAVRPLGYQRRVWPSVIELKPAKKKKRKKSPIAVVGTQLVALEWSNKKVGDDKWEMNGKTGRWRRSWNKNMFFPDDGSAPTEAGGAPGTLSGKGHESFFKKLGGKFKGVAKALKKAPAATARLYTDPKYRKERFSKKALIKDAKSVSEFAGRAAAKTWDHIKHEGHNAETAAKALWRVRGTDVKDIKKTWKSLSDKERKAIKGTIKAAAITIGGTAAGGHFGATAIAKHFLGESMAIGAVMADEQRGGWVLTEEGRADGEKVLADAIARTVEKMSKLANASEDEMVKLAAKLGAKSKMSEDEWFEATLFEAQLVSLEWSNKKVGDDKWELNGKTGRWRRSWNKNMFFPDDGSSPTEEGGAPGASGWKSGTNVTIKNFYGGANEKGGAPKAEVRDSAESGSWDSDSMKRLETKLKAIKAKVKRGGEGISDEALASVDEMLAAIKAGRAGDKNAFDAFQKADEGLAAAAGGVPGFFGSSKGGSKESASQDKGRESEPQAGAKAAPKDDKKAKSPETAKAKDSGDEDYPGAAKKSKGDYPGASKKKPKKKG